MKPLPMSGGAAAAGASPSTVRVLDAEALPAAEALDRAIHAHESPAIVIVGSAAEVARVTPMLRMQDDLARRDEGPAALAARAKRLGERHAVAAELVQRRAHVDPLTGLPDRLRCLQWFEVDENAWPADPAWGLLLMGLDMFKRFNDTEGRAAGDLVLKTVAAELTLRTRADDRVYRLEFDEFVVVMQRDSRERLVADAQALRSAISSIDWPEGGYTYPVTASAGLAFLRPAGFRYAALQQAATASYMAKILGRDNLVLHDDVRRLSRETGTTLELSDLSEQAEAAKARLAGMADEMQQRLLEDARREASIDGLTQLKNRRYFDEHIERQMQSALRDGAPLALVFLDIDDFGAFNKLHGHPAGDAVLRTFAEVAMRNVRGSDWLARYGGEEFCLVMEGTAQEGYRVAERIRHAVSRAHVKSLGGEMLNVTISVGVTEFDPRRDDVPDRLVQRASRANRAAKDAGKNRVVLG